MNLKLDEKKIHSGDAIRKIQLEPKPLVSIILAMRNSIGYSKDFVKMILDQDYINLDLILIDLSSQDETIKLLSQINDPRVSLFQTESTNGINFAKNYGISRAKGNYIVICDSCYHLEKDSISNQIDFLESHPGEMFVSKKYFSIAGLVFHTLLFRREVFCDLGYLDNVKIDAQNEYLKRMQIFHKGLSKIQFLYTWKMKQHLYMTNNGVFLYDKMRYQLSHRRWHKLLIKGKGQRYLSFPQKERQFPIAEGLRIKYPKKIDHKNTTTKIKIAAELVTASLATIPERQPMLKTVIGSIIDQVDHLHVYLNGFETIPDFLVHDKITIQRSQKNGDLADNGKFFLAHQLKGILLTIDDDIKYPKDYVAVLKNKLNQYNFKPVIGIHGVKIRENFIKYYESKSRYSIRFDASNDTDQYVHLLGTGTIGYHTHNVSFRLKKEFKKHMIDIYMGIFCQENSIPMICIQRPENWLQEIETPIETRIYNRYLGNDDVQTKLIKSRNWAHNYLDMDTKKMHQPS